MTTDSDVLPVNVLQVVQTHNAKYTKTKKAPRLWVVDLHHPLHQYASIYNSSLFQISPNFSPLITIIQRDLLRVESFTGWPVQK